MSATPQNSPLVGLYFNLHTYNISMTTNYIFVAKIRRQLTVCVKIESMLQMFPRPLSSDKAACARNVAL